MGIVDHILQLKRISEINIKSHYNIYSDEKYNIKTAYKFRDIYLSLKWNSVTNWVRNISELENYYKLRICDWIQILYQMAAISLL